MTRKDLSNLYIWIRKNNQHTPDDVVDFMYTAALEKLKLDTVIEKLKTKEKLQNEQVRFKDYLNVISKCTFGVEFDRLQQDSHKKRCLWLLQEEFL